MPEEIYFYTIKNIRCARFNASKLLEYMHRRCWNLLAKKSRVAACRNYRVNVQYRAHLINDEHIRRYQENGIAMVEDSKSAS